MMRIDECTYVVVDCETTGLHPRAHHRIVELALIPLARDGEPEDVWCTLLRPDRDLGPTDIHGIRGRDLLDAPRFEAVLGEVLDRLAGRVVVAHNARFDGSFLEHELERAGVSVAPLSTLCTMRLAGLVGLAGGGARLADCCAAIGFEQQEQHTAAADALACAALFAACFPQVAAVALRELAFGSPAPRPADMWPRDARRAACKRRGARAAVPTEPSFLARLVEEAELPDWSDAMQVAPYLDVLDRALEDRLLSRTELEDLAATAEMLGLTANRVRAVHADYVATLVALAYRDGVVTEREREDLELVAEALGVGGVEQALRQLGGFASAGPATGPETGGLVGKRVCFTGALCCSYQGRPLTRDLAHALAEQAGMVISPRVTKDLDVLVVADPNSMSSKARKARDYGVRIIAETAFWPMIGIEVE